MCDGFRHNTSEYLFEMLLNPEVWYDILYYTMLPSLYR